MHDAKRFKNGSYSSVSFTNRFLQNGSLSSNFLTSFNSVWLWQCHTNKYSAASLVSANQDTTAETCPLHGLQDYLWFCLDPFAHASLSNRGES